MMKSIAILTVASAVTTTGYPVCPIKAYKSGYDVALTNFEKMWNKYEQDCKQLDDINKHILSKSPTLKCQKRGYYDGAEQIYEKYSAECFPTCAGNGEIMGKFTGQQFCNGTFDNTTATPICNVVEENTCMDHFFDYAYTNCNEKRIDNLTVFDEYIIKYCKKF